MSLSIRHWLAENYIEISDISGLSPGQMVSIAFRIVQDMEVKSLIPLDICSLAEVLELPLAAVWQEITVFAQLTESLLRTISYKKPLKRNEGTWLAFQIAYLRGLQQVFVQEKSLQRPWLNQIMLWDSRRGNGEISQNNASMSVRLLQDSQLQGLLKTLRPGKLTDTQAEQALSLVADSLLAQQIDNAVKAWFVANGVEEVESKLITQRLQNSLFGHLLAVIAENAPPLAQLQKFVGLGNLCPVNSTDKHLQNPETGLHVGDKIDLLRELYRASLMQRQSETLFMESFALKDIYVPLNGLPINESDSQPHNTAEPIDLMTWVRQQLAHLDTIAVIESEAGYGKTSFCQMWTAVAAKEFYPAWMPILIRLKDVKYGKTLAATLNSGFALNRYIHLGDWLQQDYPPCLLVLDGLDELPPASQGNQAKIILMQQLFGLQSQSRHKIVLTSTSQALEEITQELELPLPLCRISIQPWEQEEWKQWFQLWAQVQSLPIAQNFFTFLKQSGVFSVASKLPELAALVCQPLMLYLLGVLHRDGLLDEQILLLATKTQATTSATLLWEIHQRLSRWLLGYPQTGGVKTMLLRSGSTYIHRTQDAIANLLQNRHPQDVLEHMQAIALQILHSQRHQITLEPNHSNLPAFYFIPSPTPHLQTEFSHPKLGEFLCTQAIVAQLKLLIQSQQNAYGEFTFVLESASSVAQQLYNLFGFGIVSPELENLVIESLRREPQHEFAFELLCDRLLSFWDIYCRGRWLDEGIAHKAFAYFQALQNPANVEQIHAAVGMNVFLLLCACHQQTKSTFWPCGNPENLSEFYSQALMILIARTKVLHPAAFATRLQSTSLAYLSLSGADLSQAMLAGVNFGQIDLSNTNLMGANLVGANLLDANLAAANLTGANLTDANLSGANLASANLTGANLTGANLHSTNLTNTCLFQAVLQETDKEIAILNGAIFSIKDFQIIKKLLSKSADINNVNSYEKTAVWLNNNAVENIIESAEGKPVMSGDLYEDYADDETVLG
ncbi:pentapeptide repeat-containing protein [Fischerella sp. JS2]|uniref:pentapeptide repeat-containing protein n=1 Tax=Fischerella sp. JS2 TaxID=2597771 RepID=UPI0028E579D0|nr:pentapeptide repeat-containing protein [Fischerella sp. JS2]